MLQTLLPLALVAALAGPVQDAPSGPEGADSGPRAGAPPGAEYAGAAGDLRIRTPALEDVGISVDGRFDEVAWEEAAVLTSFTQFEPVEGIEAEEDTEIRVFVTDEAIYFGITAYEDPGQIRATLGERDSFTRSDDYVRIMLDTFDDQRRAYVFSGATGALLHTLETPNPGSEFGGKFGTAVAGVPDVDGDGHGVLGAAGVTTGGAEIRVRGTVRFAALGTVPRV